MTSGRPAFQQHAKRTEGSDTTPTSHTHVWHTSHNFDRSEKRSRSPAGPRRLGTATRISASLFRRLPAFFGSTSGQDPKAAKFAVLIPGRAGFTKRTERSEGSNSAPIQNTPVSPCKPLCAILLAKASVYPLSAVKASMGRLCEKLKNAMKSGLEQRCGGSFLAIFAEVVVSEKPNFLSRIFGQ